MEHTRRRLGFGAALGLLAGGLTALAWAGEPDPRGPELLAPFKAELQQALKAGLAEGPVQAVTSCQAKAPGIAAARSQGAVRMGRTSDRLRSPANAAPEWVKPILAAYLGEGLGRGLAEVPGTGSGEGPGTPRAGAPDLTPRSLEIAPGRLGYVEPIVLQPLCETCHGTAIAADVAARIAQLYPQDAATGFRVGDVRGVFWVEYPAAP